MNTVYVVCYRHSREPVQTAKGYTCFLDPSGARRSKAMILRSHKDMKKDDLLIVEYEYYVIIKDES